MECEHGPLAEEVVGVLTHIGRLCPEQLGVSSGSALNDPAGTRYVLGIPFKDQPYTGLL